MLTSELIYWITRLDGIWNFCLATAIVSGTFLGFFTGVERMSKLIDDKRLVLSLKYLWFWLIPITFSILLVFIPTTKEMAMIYVLPKIANSEVVKELPEDFKTIKDMAMEKMKDILK